MDSQMLVVIGFAIANLLVWMTFFFFKLKRATKVEHAKNDAKILQAQLPDALLALS